MFRRHVKRILASVLPEKQRRSVVLVYHSVGQGSQYSIAPARFREQIALLADEYRIVSLDEFLRRLTNGEHHLAALTFDDGYLDNYVNVYPFLSYSKIPFGIFINTSLIGNGVCKWGKQFRGLKALNWSQISELARAGVEVGSHFHQHLRWKQCSDDAIRGQLRKSISRIAEHTQRNVRYFAYPYGQCDSRSQRILPPFGIQAAFTGVHRSLQGLGNLYRLPRLSVNAEDEIVDFRQSLRGKRDLLALIGRR